MMQLYLLPNALALNCAALIDRECTWADPNVQIAPISGREAASAAAPYWAAWHLAERHFLEASFVNENPLIAHLPALLDQHSR